MLGRTAFLIAAAAAVPVVLKKNKKLADQVGDFMVKTGENLKKGYGSAAGTQEKEPSKVSESVVQKPKAGSASPQSRPGRQSKATAASSSKPKGTAKKKSIPRPTRKSPPAS